jgi:superfamily I DNA/RNA helicase
MNYADLFTDLETGPDRGLSAATHLSSHQQEAVVAAPKGRIVVVAGPGSGKTTVLVERIAYLLMSGAAPDDLLVCTFTKAAADELQSRLAPRLRGGKQLPYCGTMHGLAYRMLGGHQWLLQQGLTLISDDEQLALLHSLLIDLDLETELSEKELLLALQRAQEGADVPAEYKVLANAWEEHLEELGYIDFVMLLRRSLSLPARKRFRFALTDEAQDLTPLQLEWLAKHCTDTAHVFLVGDDDQAVYAFRGSAQSVLADEVSRGASCIQLRDNWRCRALIVQHAQQLIAHNTNRVALPQTPTKPAGDIMVARYRDENEELQALLKMKVKPVILCRTRLDVEHFQAAGLEAYTMHESKGREWPHVFISGLELGVCPHALGELEEERRLFYVALTRAKDRLTVSVRDKVGDRGRAASPFLKEAGLL